MFTLDGIIFEEVLSAIALSPSTGKMLYRLPQVSDCTIDVTADSTDATDRRGNLIKRTYSAKACSVTLTNAHLDLNAYAATTGSEKEVASEENLLTIPKTVRVDSTETAFTLSDVPVDGSVAVSSLRNTGSIEASYDLADSPSATEFGWDESSQTVTFPEVSDETAAEISEWIIKYNYEADAAVRVIQSSEKWPKTVDLIINALGYDTCEPDVLQFFRIEFPSFQPSPETSISMTTDATFDYSGDAQTDYCAKNRVLYVITAGEGDIEEDDTEN